MVIHLHIASIPPQNHVLYIITQCTRRLLQRNIQEHELLAAASAFFIIKHGKIEPWEPKLKHSHGVSPPLLNAYDALVHAKPREINSLT